MDRLGSADILFFEGFRLDRSGGGLFRLDQEGIAEPVVIGSRALDLLGLLVERQGGAGLERPHHGRPLAGNDRRGSQPDSPHFDVAPHP